MPCVSAALFVRALSTVFVLWKEGKPPTAPSVSGTSHLAAKVVHFRESPLNAHDIGAFLEFICFNILLFDL